MTAPAFVPSPEQEKVIAHRGGHLQVIACAGAGKTESISRRVASLILDGFEPAQIIAFTFTEREAASLKTRITSGMPSRGVRLSSTAWHRLQAHQSNQARLVKARP
jgi:superfamily I DNA/RNA helicase